MQQRLHFHDCIKDVVQWRYVGVTLVLHLQRHARFRALSSSFNTSLLPPTIPALLIDLVEGFMLFLQSAS